MQFNTFSVLNQFIDKLMHLGRQSFCQKSSFKFSNQLAGKIYNNLQFLNSCPNINNTAKLSAATSSQRNRATPQKIFKGLQISNVPSSKGRSFSRETKSANKLQDNAKNDLINQLLKRIPQTPKKQNSTQNDVKKVVKRGSSLLQATLTFATQIIKKVSRKKSLKRKMAFNPSVDSFYSPFIYIRIIDKIKDLRQLEDRSIKINFQKIYKKLFKTQLMGEFTANFMEAAQRYIRQIVQSGEMYQNPFGIQLQPELKAISRKQQLLDKLNELWGENEQFKIHELIKFYCIPSQQTSKKMLRQLISDLVLDIYQRKSCNRDVEYVLLTEKGIQITHISQIYFSTLQLLIAPKQTANFHYHNFNRLIEQHNRSLKLTMRESLKRNFVQKIVCNQVDNHKVNYTDDPHEYNSYRKQIVDKAAAIIESKSKHRLQSKRQRYSSQNDNYQLQASQKDNLFTNYILRKRKQRKQYKSILQKLRKILDPHHSYTIKSKLHDKTQEEFKKLRMCNDQYDITYNYQPQSHNKILVTNLVENCTIFNNKTPQQLQKLLHMLSEVYGKDKGQLEEISYQQFQQIYETAHGVAHQDVIMKFVLSYLSFDIFGQMKKQDFFNIIDTCLSQYGRPQRLIKIIFWSYFQKMQLVRNNCLMRRNLQVWYQPIKVVYLLLLSIIFGSQYQSIQQMINDLIQYDYQQ